MSKIAHIINVTEINESKKASYLHIAQPVTMKSMVIAQQMAQDVVDVDLVAVKHKNENVVCPPEFSWAEDLENYAYDYIESLRNTSNKKPLPRLTDILNSLYKSSDAEYFIYTNLDIGLYPQFYLKIKEIIELGYDAFAINRRDLPTEYDGILLDDNKIEMIFTLKGLTHPGIDCFVFKREIVPRLNLNNVYIGFPPVGQVLKHQIEINSQNFIWLKNQILTFHLGQEQGWNRGGIYQEENRNQAQNLYTNCLSQIPPLHSRVEHKFKSWLLEKLSDDKQEIYQLNNN
ncbi:MAG: hypothetical protein Tsb0014_20240 [Pleurocapsa sp.]